MISYLKYCKTLYESAIAAHRQNDMRRSYINLYRFQELALKYIPSHKDYNTKSPITHSAKEWLEKTKIPAMAMLEEIVYRLDLEEDERIRSEFELDLIDEFEDPPPAAAPLEVEQPALAIEANHKTVKESEPQRSLLTRNLADLSILAASAETAGSVGAAATGAGAGAGVHTVGQPATALQYSVPNIEYPEENPESRDVQLAASSGLLSTILRTDVTILQCLGNYRQ